MAIKINTKPIEKMSLKECQKEAQELMKMPPAQLAKEPNWEEVIRRAMHLMARVAVLTKLGKK